MLAPAAFAADDLVYDKATQQTLKNGELTYFLQSKNGAGEKNNAVCEDGLFFNDHYLAVFDGATDKSGKTYDGKKGDALVAILFNPFSNNCHQIPLKKKS